MKSFILTTLKQVAILIVCAFPSFAQTIQVASVDYTRFDFGATLNTGGTLNGNRMVNHALPKLTNTANFGIGGTVPHPLNITHTFTTVGSITVASLAPYDIFFVGACMGGSLPLSTAEVQAIYTWSQQPGNVVIVAEQPSANTHPVTLGYGYALNNTNVNPTTPTLADDTFQLFSGVFGNVTSISQGGGAQGIFSQDCYSTVIGRNATNAPTIIFNATTRDILLADLDFFSTTGNSITAGGAITNGTDKAWGNLWAWAINEVLNPGTFTLPVTATTTPACTSNTGTITFTAPLGNSSSGQPYLYSINGGATYQTNPVFSNVSAGTYTIFCTTSTVCPPVSGGTVTVAVGPAVNVTAFLTKCPSQLPTTWNGIIIPTGAVSNPAYTTYTTTNSAGCDSTVTLNLTISPSVNSTAFLTKCPNQLPATWNGITIPVGATSNPAYTTFTTTNSAGCDSTVTLNLTVNPSVMSTAFLTKCPGQLPTTWNGITIPVGATSNPAYTTYTTTNSAGCDSTVTLNLTVNPSVTSTAFLTKCPSQLPTTWNGITIPAGATSNPAYTTYTTTNTAGCDSTITLNLTISPSVNSTAFLTKCPSQLPTTWNGITIPAGATSNPAYTTYTTTNTAGCDSTITLNLTVNPSVTSTAFLTKCPGQLPTTWNGITIPVGATSNPAYTTFTTTNSAGCDSTVTLNLTINPNINNSVTATICNGQTYTFGTQTLNTSGIYTHVFPATNTCDSAVMLTLTVKPPATILNVNLAGCESVTFEGVTYTTSTELENTYTNANGCDSVIRRVHIIVKQPVTNIVTADICRGGSYPFNGTNYSNTGTYTATFTAANGCDSISRLELTVHELPVVTLTEQGTDHPHYCLGDTVNLTASGANSYLWWLNNNSPLPSVGATEAVPVYTNNQKVWVEGSDNYGCSDTAEMVIKAQGCCILMMPNAFSPNGDGMNDKFGPETNGHPKGYAMHIYNRWGQMIYVSYKIEQKWDGIYSNGQPAELGTYYYMITGDCATGELIQMKGDITLLR
jgi:gliding motility-associated-like protein